MSDRKFNLSFLEKAHLKTNQTFSRKSFVNILQDSEKESAKVSTNFKLLQLQKPKCPNLYLILAVMNSLTFLPPHIKLLTKHHLT